MTPIARLSYKRYHQTILVTQQGRSNRFYAAVFRCMNPFISCSLQIHFYTYIIWYMVPYAKGMCLGIQSTLCLRFNLLIHALDAFCWQFCVNQINSLPKLVAR